LKKLIQRENLKKVRRRRKGGIFQKKN